MNYNHLAEFLIPPLLCSMRTFKLIWHFKLVSVKPVNVKIVSPHELLSAKKSRQLLCESNGSYPPARVTWLLDGEPIRHAATMVSIAVALNKITPLQIIDNNNWHGTKRITEECISLREIRELLKTQKIILQYISVSLLYKR